MTVLMLLLLILAAMLITVAVYAKPRRIRAVYGNTTHGNVALTHQSYADAGGVIHHEMWSHHGKAYDTAQNVEAKARDWICGLHSNYHHALPNRVLPARSSLTDRRRIAAIGLAA